MTIDQRKSVDLIGIDNKTNEVVLTIVDHYEWNKNDQKHLNDLQEKINYYVAFIESGEIYKKYPKAKDRKITIETIGTYPLNEIARNFYDKASNIVEKVGLKLKFLIQTTK